jgi:hypothetical protein|tara:strand:- start:163 stop:996 length:834 start_codon:yes stop_codon:yes gene_type:complete
MFNITKQEIQNSSQLQQTAKDWACVNLEYLNKPMKILGTSIKVQKGADKFNTYIVYLQPANKVAVKTLCDGAEASGCKRDCLISSGQLGMTLGQSATTKKTILYLLRNVWFNRQLLSEIDTAERKAKRDGIPALFRLNGTSDINFEYIVAERPDSMFYDYTKILSRLRKNILSNYDLTFSGSMYTKQSKNALRKAVQRKHRIAVAFNTKSLKDDELKLPVDMLSFDKTDLRHLDSNSIGHLKRKGSNKEQRRQENKVFNSFFVTLENLKEFNNIVGV